MEYAQQRRPQAESQTLDALRLRAVDQEQQGGAPGGGGAGPGAALQDGIRVASEVPGGRGGAPLARPVPGRPPRLTPLQMRRLWTLIVGGAWPIKRRMHCFRIMLPLALDGTPQCFPPVMWLPGWAAGRHRGGVRVLDARSGVSVCHGRRAVMSQARESKNTPPLDWCVARAARSRPSTCLVLAASSGASRSLVICSESMARRALAASGP
jgi:hypothetical protein